MSGLLGSAVLGALLLGSGPSEAVELIPEADWICVVPVDDWVCQPGADDWTVEA